VPSSGATVTLFDVVPRWPDGPATVAVHVPMPTWLNVVVYVDAPGAVRTSGCGAGGTSPAAASETIAPVRSAPLADVTVTCTWRAWSWTTTSRLMPCPGVMVTCRTAVPPPCPAGSVTVTV